MNKLLTIVMPTYNRAEMLDANISNISRFSLFENIDFIVCNNGSNDDTQKVLDKWAEQLPNLRVINHETNVLYDRNVASGYMTVETKYCWLMGDSRTIDEVNFDKILKTIDEEQPQVLIINDDQGNAGTENKSYKDARELLREIGWYLTLQCSFIIRKDSFSLERCQRYFDTNFEHEGVLFDYLSTYEEVNVIVRPSIHICPLNVKNKVNNAWGKEPFDIFVRSWFSFIMSLPNKYTLEDKLYCIKQHERHQHLLSPSSIIRGRLSGVMTFKDYSPNRALMRFAVDYPLFVSDLISWLPPMPRLYKWLKSILK